MPTDREAGDADGGQFAATVVAAAVVAESSGSSAKTSPAARGASLLGRATSSSAVRSEGGQGGWRKVLYGQQPFPDNHIDGSFLDELQRNGTADRGPPTSQALVLAITHARVHAIIHALVHAIICFGRPTSNAPKPLMLPPLLRVHSSLLQSMSAPTTTGSWSPSPRPSRST